MLLALAEFRRRGLALGIGISGAALLLLAAYGWTPSLSAQANAQGSPLSSPGFHVEHRSFKAEVLERLRTGSYTYYRVRSPDGQESWLVTMGPAVDTDGIKQINSYGRRSPFHSPSLQRSFETLHFGTITPVSE